MGTLALVRLPFLFNFLFQPSQPALFSFEPFLFSLYNISQRGGQQRGQGNVHGSALLPTPLFISAAEPTIHPGEPSVRTPLAPSFHSGQNTRRPYAFFFCTASATTVGIAPVLRPHWCPIVLFLVLYLPA